MGAIFVNSLASYLVLKVDDIETHIALGQNINIEAIEECLDKFVV